MVKINEKILIVFHTTLKRNSSRCASNSNHHAGLQPNQLGFFPISERIDIGRLSLLWYDPGTRTSAENAFPCQKY